MGVALYLNRRLRYYFFGPSSALTLWPFVSQWQSASDEDWALALAREAVIRLLTDQPEVTEELVVTASDELEISRSLVYRLVAKFRTAAARSIPPWRSASTTWLCVQNEDVHRRQSRCVRFHQSRQKAERRACRTTLWIVVCTCKSWWVRANNSRESSGPTFF